MASREIPALAVFIAALVLGAHPAEAQLLRGASETVRSSEPSPSSSRSSSSSSSSDDSSSSSSSDSTLGRSSRVVRSGGGGGGRVSVGVQRSYWAPRYHDESVVYGSAYATTPSAALVDGTDPEARTLVVPQLEGSYVLDGVGRGTAAVRVILPIPMELLAGYSAYFEPLDGGGIEALVLGRIGAAYRAIDDGPVQLRIGGALRHWQDYQGARFGGELLAGLELFPGEPVVLTAEGGLGVVGDAWAFELRASIGVIIEVVELYVGWHHVALEAMNGTGGVELTGPMAGVRLWL